MISKINKPYDIICITCDENYNITDVNVTGLKFLGYGNIKELEFKSIATIIPQPSSSLHHQIFKEMSKTFADKSKYFKIVDIADNEMNEMNKCEIAEKEYMKCIIDKLQECTSPKMVLTKDNLEKLACIYIDLLSNRKCNVYMRPFDMNEHNTSTNSVNNKTTSGHQELTPQKTGALITVLRKIKKVIYP
jgi:hypothetical protein